MNILNIKDWSRDHQISIYLDDRCDEDNCSFSHSHHQLDELVVELAIRGGADIKSINTVTNRNDRENTLMAALNYISLNLRHV